MGRTAWWRPQLVLFIGLMCLARPVGAYSVLAHETVVDSAWDEVLEIHVAYLDDGLLHHRAG